MPGLAPEALQAVRGRWRQRNRAAGEPAEVVVGPADGALVRGETDVVGGGAERLPDNDLAPCKGFARQPDQVVGHCRITHVARAFRIGPETKLGLCLGALEQLAPEGGLGPLRAGDASCERVDRRKYEVPLLLRGLPLAVGRLVRDLVEHCAETRPVADRCGVNALRGKKCTEVVEQGVTPVTGELTIEAGELQRATRLGTLAHIVEQRLHLSAERPGA